MVRFFQSVIGKETMEQIATRGINAEVLVACVGGGSNAIGFFSPFIEAESPRLIGVEAGGKGSGPGQHAVRMNGQGRRGIVQGYKSRFLLDDDGQVQSTHSISAGLDYPGIGPQLAHLGETGRIEFTSAGDEEALDAMRFFARNEGVSFALATLKIAARLQHDQAVIVNMSGRGDKDLFITADALAPEEWIQFLEKEVSTYVRT
jgi:tryptophan synthase beta chain